MSRKMNYGMKISKPGFDVLNLDKDKSQSEPKENTLPNLLSSLALPYLIGAKTQVQRYQSVAAALKKNSSLSTLMCLHEASTLFEDLNTIVKYVEMCGHKNDLNKTWLDVRNHVRHDVREEYDNESDSRKNKRAKSGLNPQFNTAS